MVVAAGENEVAAVAVATAGKSGSTADRVVSAIRCRSAIDVN